MGSFFFAANVLKHLY